MWMVLIASVASAVAWRMSLKAEHLLEVREEREPLDDLERFDRFS